MLVTGGREERSQEERSQNASEQFFEVVPDYALYAFSFAMCDWYSAIDRFQV